MAYSNHFSTMSTPQTEQASPAQKRNNAGGYSFTVSPWDQLDRFLILGAVGGTYYVSEKKLTVENGKNVIECLKLDGLRTVARIVEVSDRGLAPKNDPAIFALAIAAGADDPATRAAALAALPKVCRIGTHLFHFVRDVESFRRWGRSLRRAVANWYTERPAEKLAVQLVKYRQRDGWSHRDVMRLAHPVAPTPEHATLFRYALGAELGERTVKRGDASKTYPAVGDVSPFIAAFEEAQKTDNKARICALVREQGLTHEMLPTEWKNHVEVWEALLEKMPMTAMVRNLGKMTAVGLVKPLSAASRQIAERLTNSSAIRKARMHPLNLLVALRTYQQGHGDKGSLTWSPDRAIVDALDSSFYLSFETVEPTGKNIFLALDVSGSMSERIAGSPLSCRDATAALAMVTARTEQNWFCMGFCDSFVELNISPRQRLDDVLRTIGGLPFGSTDCSLPMVYAQRKKLDVDAFVVFTDNETYAGRAHPHQELKRYRQQSGRNAKLIVNGMTATEFTIADPSDAGMLDVVGFSADVPAVMANFIRGESNKTLHTSDE